MLHIPVTIDSLNVGQLQFQDDAIRRLSLLRPGRISINATDCVERREVEAFIERIYAKSYGALIAEHYPTLVSVRDQQGSVVAALGFRCAAEHAVFLEQYIDVPLEQAVSQAVGHDVSRATIVEVGSLASTGHGAAVFLFVALTAYLDRQGYSHLVLTGTKILRGYFRKLNLDPRDMGRAERERLADRGASWGSYYETEPRLIAGDIRASYAQLQKVMLVKQVCGAGIFQTQIHPKV